MAIYRRILYFIVCLFLAMFCYLANAQQKMDWSFDVRGLVVDDMTGVPLSDVAIAFLRNGDGVTSDKDGYFTINVMRAEGLRFSAINYETRTEQVPDSIIDLQVLYLVRMESKHYDLEEYEAVGNDVPLRYRSDVFAEEPPLAAKIIMWPSYLYYRFSKREKTKRDIIKLVEKERAIARFAHVYNIDEIAKLSGFSGDTLEQCVIHCNEHVKITLQDTEEIVKHKMLVAVSGYYSSIK